MDRSSLPFALSFFLSKCHESCLLLPVVPSQPGTLRKYLDNIYVITVSDPVVFAEPSSSILYPVMGIGLTGVDS